MLRRAIAVSLLLLTYFPATALAQLNETGPDFIPPEFLDDRGRRLEGDRIRFCLNSESTLREFERAVGQALADALFLEAEFTEITATRPTPAYDYRFPVDQQQLFILLTNECVAFLGFVLSTRDYPSWLSLTRPYLQTRFVFATLDDAPSLEQLSRADPIGTRMLNAADLRFVSYNDNLPSDRKFRRVPYQSNESVMTYLLNGTLGAALIWEPGLRRALSEQDVPEGKVRVLQANRFTPPDVMFGIALRERDAFLRSSLDEGIVFLVEQGIIAELIEEHGLAGSAPRVR